MITLVTTTRDRALCFGLLEQWMAKQTLSWDQWIVVNDGQEEYKTTMGQEVISRNPTNDLLPSIVENWLAALPLIKGDRVFVIEDDDYYDPRHLATLNTMLDEVDLAGISHDVYFKFPTRKFKRMHNEHHASLACTAFRMGIKDGFERVCRVLCKQSVFIDMFLWPEAGNIWPATKKLLKQPLADGRMLHVGMKGMPGAFGLGIGHQDMHDGSDDYSFAILRQWIGPEAAGIYRRLWQDTYQR